MKSNLLVCPNCRRKARFINRKTKAVSYPLLPNVLGEVRADGSILLKREGFNTIVTGQNLQVACGACGELVFYREGGGTDDIRNIGIRRIYRFSLVQSVISLGTYSIADFKRNAVRPTGSQAIL